MSTKLILSILVLVLVVGGLAWLLSRGPVKEEVPDFITETADDIQLPPGARSIDGFAFADASGVFFRSTFSTSTVKIPDADPKSFRVVSSIEEYANEEILAFCKGPGNYGLYADADKAYLFQFWKTPTFAKTRIDVIKDLNPDFLSVSGPQTFTDGTVTYTLGHEFATTTCAFVAKPL